jgi:hypothetical protein
MEVWGSIERTVDITCDARNTKSGMSNIVRRNMNFPSEIIRIAQTLAIRVVRI